MIDTKIIHETEHWMIRALTAEAVLGHIATLVGGAPTAPLVSVLYNVRAALKEERSL